jgi:hypothetical protein
MHLELLDGLNRILDWHNQNKFEDEKYLQPGLSKAEIDDLLQDVGLELPSEFYTLYQWRNGSQQGLFEDENAFIFGIWTFLPLQKVLTLYQQKLLDKQFRNTKNIQFDYIDYFPKKFCCLDIFKSIDYTYYGYLWLEPNLTSYPIFFNRSIPGEESRVLERYSSLTSMVLTKAECYEKGLDKCRNNLVDKIDEQEHQIWKKYNCDLKKLSQQILKKKLFSRLTWINSLYELVKFPDENTCEFLIDWLTVLLNCYKQGNYFGLAGGWMEEKLYRENSQYLDYFDLETGLPKLLGELNNVKATPILIELLENDNLYQYFYHSRVFAARALGQLKDKRAIFPLIEVLKNENPEVQNMAIWALGEIGAPQAIKPLVELLSSEEELVRDSAKDVLRKLIVQFPEFKNDIPF